MIPDVAQSWHAQAPEEVIRGLESSRSGLSAEEARTRLERVGPNALQAAHRTSPWRLLADELPSRRYWSVATSKYRAPP